MEVSMRLLSVIVLVAAASFAHAGEAPKKRPAVRALAYSADGKFLAATAGETNDPGYATVWSLPAGTRVFSYESNKGVPVATFSPDGKWLVLGGFTPEAVIVDTATWKIERKLPGHGAAARGAAFSSDGQTLVVTSYDGFINIWDTATWLVRKTIENAHAGWVYAAAITKDGKTLASSSADNTAKLWDMKTGACLHTFKHESIIRHIHFSADDRCVVYASWDGTLAIRDRESGKMMLSLERAGSADDVVITKDCTAVAYTGGAVRLARVNLRPADEATLAELRRLLKGWDDDSFAARDKTSKTSPLSGSPWPTSCARSAKNLPLPKCACAPG
jgi:WD40 repeat protein